MTQTRLKISGESTHKWKMILIKDTTHIIFIFNAILLGLKYRECDRKRTSTSLSFAVDQLSIGFYSDVTPTYIITYFRSIVLRTFPIDSTHKSGEMVIWCRNIDRDNNLETMLVSQPGLQHHIVIFPDLWVESIGNVMRTIGRMICEMQQSNIYRHYPIWQMLFDSLAVGWSVFIRKLVILQPHI